MRIGVTVFLTDQTIGPAELGRALAERGFQSYYAPEHTHIPISRATPRRSASRCRTTTPGPWIPSSR